MLIGCVEKSNAVDVNIEVRSRTLLRLVEVTVGNNLGVGGVVIVGVDVSLVAGEGLAVNGEGGCVENMESAGLELIFGSLDGLGSAGSGDLLVDGGQARQRPR